MEIKRHLRQTWRTKVDLAACRLRDCARVYVRYIRMDKRDIKIDTARQLPTFVFEEEIIPITEQPNRWLHPPEAPSIAETLTIVDDDADGKKPLSLHLKKPIRLWKSNMFPVAVEEEEPEEQTIFGVGRTNAGIP